MLEGNTKGAILVVTYERWHTTTYIGVGNHYPYLRIIDEHGGFHTAPSETGTSVFKQCCGHDFNFSHLVSVVPNTNVVRTREYIHGRKRS